MSGITMTEYLKKVNRNPAVRSMINMECGMGLPAVETDGKKIIVEIPYFKEVYYPEDNTLVYPFEFVVTSLWDSAKLVRIYATEYSDRFAGIELYKPIGKFRHEAVKNMTRSVYLQEKDNLYKQYDIFLNALTTGAEYSAEAEASFKKQLNIIIEPGLIPFYRIIARGFTDRFILSER